ncbi:MAG: anthranilate phosphoribosyltransferase [Candidatus Binatia bacterium]|nr:anthranilate phosphoribosyltransferase [Candidatus Binatia bacterium]
MSEQVVGALKAFVDGRDLQASEAEAVMLEVMGGEVSPVHLAGLLVAWRMKGETVAELVGAARAMRARAENIRPQVAVVDTCGTGGDGKSTFNISTAAALIAAAAGAAVAKHGNRAVSGRVGGADILEALGVRIDLPPDQVRECIEATGFGFLFAPRFHPAMRHVAPVRRELGLRTIFNLLGPLANPAGAKRQLVGVFAGKWLEPLAWALAELGAEHAMVVHSEDGLDEISLSAPTQVCEWRGGELRRWRLDPARLGFSTYPREAFVCPDLLTALERMQAVLHGEPGPCTEVAELNAGAALYVAGHAATLEEGVRQAHEAIVGGVAWQKLQQVIAWTNR